MRSLTTHVFLLAVTIGGVAGAQEPPGPPVLSEDVTEAVKKAADARPKPPTTKPTAAKKVPQRARVVFGTAVDRDGEPLAGVGVTLGSIDTVISADCLLEPLARTDAKGRFSFTLLPPKESEIKERLYLVACAADRVSLRVKMPKISYAAVEKWRAPKTDEEKLAVIGFDILARVWGRSAEVKRDGIEVNLELCRGVMLKGRLVDGANEPVAGARIRAEDLLTHSRFRGVKRAGKKLYHYSYATSGADGSFELPGVLPTGSVLTVKADGFYPTTHEVAGARDDLVLTIRSGGSVSGRIFNHDGKPGEATLQVMYELGRTTYTEKVDEDGKFEFNLRFPERYRIVATPKGKSAKDHAKTYSAILEGPKRMFLRLAKKKPKNTKRKPKPKRDRRSRAVKLGFPVSVVDKATGRPLRKFKAKVQWVVPTYKVNDAYYESRFNSGAKQSKQLGYIRLQGPATSNLEKGSVMVKARGYAMFFKFDLEWNPLRPEPVVAEMVPESIIGGVVRDDVSGEAIPNAQVYLYKYSRDRSNSRSVSARSDKDGRFVFKGLRAGHYRLDARHLNRRNKSVDIDLREEEKRCDLVLNLGHAPAVRGRIVGIKLGKGWQVELLNANAIRNLMYNPNSRLSGKRGDLAADGTFEVKGVTTGYWEICLRIPRDPRKGSAMQIPLEPIRVRKRDVNVVVDASEDMPGRLHGKVTFPGKKIDAARLMVVAVPYVPESPYNYYYNNNVDLSGARSSVAADGGFDLEVTSGQKRIKIFDLLTGIQLFQTQLPIEVGAAQSTEENLDLALTEVRVKLKPSQKGGRVSAAWLNINVEQPKPEALQMFVFWSGSSGRRPVGVSLVGKREVQLVLPPYKTKFQVWTGVARLARTRNRTQSTVGDAEVTPKLGETNEVEIEIEIPDGGFDPVTKSDDADLGLTKEKRERFERFFRRIGEAVLKLVDREARGPAEKKPK